MNTEFRYLLFGFNFYDKSGGFNDFIFGFNTFEDFKNKLDIILEDFEKEIYEILDLTKLSNFRVLYLEERNEDINIKSKLKKAVYDKTR